MPFTNYSDTASLLARIEALELALFGRLTGLPANQLLGSGAGGGVAVPIPQANFVDVSSAQNIGGSKTFTDPTESTSTTTGGAVFAGGVGIAKNLFVGGITNIPGRFGQLEGHGAWPNQDSLDNPFGCRFCVTEQAHILKFGIGSEYPTYFIEMKISRYNNNLYVRHCEGGTYSSWVKISV